MEYPTFREIATKRVTFHPPKDGGIEDRLGIIRGKFQNLIDDVASVIPQGPDATTAANAIGDACQKCIQAVIYNQDKELGLG